MWNWLFPRVFCSQQKSSQYQRTIRMDIFLLPLLVFNCQALWGAEPWCISLALPVDYPTVNGRLFVACLVLLVQKLCIA